MSTVQEIEAAIEKLPRAEFFALVERLRERHAAAWDRQIEDDASAGRLDFLVHETEAEISQGRARPMDELCDNR